MCADTLAYLMQSYSLLERTDVGLGKDLSVLDLARLVCDNIGFKGEVAFDLSKPDAPLGS